MATIVRLFEPGVGAVSREVPGTPDAQGAAAMLGVPRSAILSLEPRGQSADGSSQNTAAHEHATAAQGAVSEVKPLRHSPKTLVLDNSWWCRELRTLVAAGMTVVEALETMELQTAGGVRSAGGARGPSNTNETGRTGWTEGQEAASARTAARAPSAAPTASRQLLEALHRGLPLSQAMASVGAFPPLLVAGVKASERSRALTQALDDFLEYDSAVSSLRQKLKSAMIYPLMVAGVGLCIAAFLLTFVMPQFAAMYTDSLASVSVATRVVLGVAGALTQHADAFAAAFAVAAVVVFWLVRTGRAARWTFAALLRVGPSRRLLEHYSVANFYRCLALLLRGGYPVHEALAHTVQVGFGGMLSGRVHAAKACVETGKRVSDSFAQAALADETARRLLAVGERVGSFDAVLQTIAARHAQAFSTGLERATRLAEPLLLLVVSTLVGGLVVLMYMPVFDVAASVR